MTSPLFYGCFGATQFDWLTNSVLLSQPIKAKAQPVVMCSRTFSRPSCPLLYICYDF